MRRRCFGVVGMIGVCLASMLAASQALAQDGDGASRPALRDGFEDGLPRWLEEEVPSDATFILRSHERSDAGAREGRFAERFEFEAGPGSVLYYSYRLPKVPITSDLRATLFAKSNRTGVRIYGHVILPKDIDPDTGQPSYLLVAGSALETPERWERLELSQLPLAVERQARVLRAGTQRPVSLEGAYLDRLVVNLYGGPGESVVDLDELIVEPVLVDEAAGPMPSAPSGRNEADVPGGRLKAVELVANHLKRAGNPWFPRGISAPTVEMESLRRAGFDVIEISENADPELARKVIDLGYQLMPRLNWDSADSAESALARVDAYPHAKNVAFWSLGNRLGVDDDRESRKRELDQVRKLVTELRADGDVRDSARLSFGTVADLFPQYALFGRNLDVVAVEPPSVASSYDPMSTYHHLSLCRALTASRNPNALFWAWVPASAPPALRQAVWGDDVPPAWGWPTVSPDQIRLYTYAALMAGYRGIGFRGDTELARDSGLDRLYELTLLIAEIELVEEILARGSDPIAQWPVFPRNPERQLVYSASGRTGMLTTNRQPSQRVSTKEVSALPNVRVAAIDSPDHRSKLLLVADLAQAGQWQPPQMAYHSANLLLPAPESAQAFEIVLGDDVRKLESKRDAGGRRITIPLLNTTTMVLVTTDFALVERLRGMVMAIRPKVVDLAIKQAEMRLDETLQIAGALKARGITVRDQDDLLTNENLQSARAFLANARDARNRADYETAWNEARSVALPIRVVMRDHFERALADLERAVAASLATDSVTNVRPAKPWITPVSCPPLVCANTLPQYYYWREFVAGERGAYGANRVATGEFEAPPGALRENGWTDASHPQDGFTGAITVDSGSGFGNRGAALKLSVRASETVDRSEFVKPDGSFDAAAFDTARRAVVDSLPPALRYPVAAVRTPPIAVQARDFVRIRVKVRMPQSMPSGGSGLIVRDSLGGEFLQFSTIQPTREWREVVLFRRVHEPGELTVTLGLAGLGECYFDDLNVEILGQNGGETLPPASEGPPGTAPSIPSATLPPNAIRR